MEVCVMVVLSCVFLFFKQKSGYDLRISDWSSDVCAADLRAFLDLVEELRIGDRVAAGLGGTAVEQRDDERQRDQDSHPDHQALHPGIAAAVVVGALLLVVVVHERWYLSWPKIRAGRLMAMEQKRVRCRAGAGRG